MKRMHLSKLHLVDSCFNAGWFGLVFFFFKKEEKKVSATFFQYQQSL